MRAVSNPPPWGGATLLALGLPAQLGYQLACRNTREGLANELRDHLPIWLRVEDHTDPAARADVGWPKEAGRIELDQRLLHTDGLREPDGKVLRTMVVVVEHREDLALAGKPGGLTVGEALSCLGKAETDLAQAFDEGRVPRSDAPNRVSGGLLARQRRAASGLLCRRFLRRG